MKIIDGYDIVNEAGEFKRLPAGIYKLQIKEVIDVSDKEYLDVRFDIIDGEFKGYFSLTNKGFGSSTRSYKQNALPFFKQFIKAVEKTNTGYTWNWDEKTLAGKYVVGVFGDEEYIQDGEIKVSAKLVEFRSAQALKEGKLKAPELKKLPDSERPVEKSNVTLNDPSNVLSEVMDGDLPF